MWIFTKEGFFSAVADPRFCKPGEVVVRARSKDDLIRLGDKIGFGYSVIETPGGDYYFRMVVSKNHWAAYVRDAAIDIDYDNFKDAMAGELRGDRGRMTWLHEVWFAGLSYQRGPCDCGPNFGRYRPGDLERFEGPTLYAGEGVEVEGYEFEDAVEELDRSLEENPPDEWDGYGHHSGQLRSGME